MSRHKKDPVPIDPEVRKLQETLDENEELGFMTSRVNRNGVRTYKLTAAGKKRAEAIFRAAGVDPNDKAAVEEYIFGKREPPR